jgi:hypothetical protein
LIPLGKVSVFPLDRYCFFLYNKIMKLVCLDLEGSLVPEIWIAFSEAAGIPEFRKTTRDEPDYDKLMRFRIELLKAQLQKVRINT